MFKYFLSDYISIHNFMIIVGFVAMCVINAFRAKNYAFKWWQGLIISVIVNIYAIFGARLLFTIENIGYVIENGLTLWGGVSFFGTVMFLPVLVVATCKIFKLDVKRYLDFLTPTVPIELACIRIGCFLGGCCYGRQFAFGIAMPTEPGVLRIPAQLIECALDIGIFVFLILYERKYGKQTGRLYPLFLICYGSIRFVIEFLRENKTIFTYSHLFSVLSIIAGVYFYLQLKKNTCAPGAENSGGQNLPDPPSAPCDAFAPPGAVTPAPSPSSEDDKEE